MGNIKMIMSGEELAQEVMDEFGTNDIFVLCERAGIIVHFEKWHPVTLGEFDRKTNAICVNLNAKIDQKQIIAHELGHYFIHQKGIKLSRNEEEKIVDDFTKTMLST